MLSKLTNEVLEARLKCRYKAHLKMAGEQGSPHDYELLLIESRGQVRAAARAKLLARHAGQDVPTGVPLTADLLGKGLPLLLDTVYEDDDLCVRFDALLRDGDSRQYIPVIFSESEKTTADMRLLLGLYGAILAGVQGKEPASGILFHGLVCQERKVKLVGAHHQARRLLREVKEARTGPPPRLLLNGHCHVCEFHQRCQTNAAAKDDLSLLRGIGEKEVEQYGKRGIFTVTQLSFTFRPPRRTKKQEERKVVHSPALQALSIRERKVHVLGSPSLPGANKRIYLDLEGDPERDFCYLAGMVVREGEVEQRHSFWIDSPADEPKLLDQVLAIAGQDPSAWLYAYGGYEAAFLRRVGKAAGREEEVAKTLARLCNLLSVVHNHVYFPVHSNGLKDIAGHLGFRWTEPDASGIQSIVWRRRWEQTADPATKEKLRTYNIEDCEALRTVSEFLYAVCVGAEDRPLEHPVARVEETPPTSTRREWCRMDCVLSDFKFVNERAYFDYQRDRVYVRTSKVLRKSQKRNCGRKGKRNIPVNRRVELNAETCPFCGSEELNRVRHGILARLAFDLWITSGGVRRWVTRFRTSYHDCAACGKRFLPWQYLRLDPHCHALKSWAMNQHVTRRTPLAGVAEMIIHLHRPRRRAVEQQQRRIHHQAVRLLPRNGRWAGLGTWVDPVSRVVEPVPELQVQGSQFSEVPPLARD